MEVEKILRGIRARAPWRSAASVMLKAAGIHVGHGFDDTFPALLKPKALAEDVTAELEDRLIEHMISGEKSLRLYKKQKSTADALVAKASSKKTGTHRLVGSFPGVLTESELAEFGDLPPQFCKYIERDDGHALIFVGVRSYQERVELAPESLKASAAQQHEFESIIGIVNRRRQVYDAIWIPKKGSHMIVAADYPKSAISEFASASHIALERMLHREGGVEPEAINLWPAVDGLYDAQEGEVVELGFVTDDDSVKHLKARQGKKCLRKDAYHAAGSEVVGDSLQPFKLAVAWKRVADGVTTHPEVLLPGTSKLIFGVNPVLLDAVFRNGLSVGDMNFVISKLTPHL